MAVFCKPSDKGQLIIHKNRSFNFSLDSKTGNLEQVLKRAAIKKSKAHKKNEITKNEK